MAARAPAPTWKLTPAPPRSQDIGDVGVTTLLRVKEGMKQQLMEYSTAVHGSKENFLDHIVEENFLQGAAQNLTADTAEAKVSVQNKTLALQRMQILHALRNKVNQDDEDSRLILETMKHIVFLSRAIIEHQQQAREKEQQLIDIQRKRFSLKDHEEQNLEETDTTVKDLKETQTIVNVTEAERTLKQLEKERGITTIIQNVFQNIIIGSRVNWAEDESLKAIVLQLENDP